MSDPVRFPYLARVTWHVCARCHEPINPEAVLGIRPPREAGQPPAELPPMRWYHPGGPGGCLVAAKDQARRDYQDALDRVMAALADDATPTPPPLGAGDPWGPVRAQPPTIAWHDEGR
jgi:hypothetical protein